MKNRILKFVFSVGLSLTLTMSCISPVFTYAAEVEEVNEVDEVSGEKMMTLTSQETHDYRMWLFENEEHIEETSDNPVKTILRAAAENESSYSGKCGDDVYFTYDESSKTLSISGTGEMWNTNETTYSQYPWNNYKNEVKELTIGNGVTYISGNAFNSFDSITSIYVPSSVKELGCYSFAYCKKLKSITVCAELINQLAFYGCPSLTDVNISGVKDIAWRAFSSCKSLTSITIPSSIDVLWQPFYNCTSLESINVSNDNQFFSSVDGVLFDKDVKTLYYYPSNKSGALYTIPSTVNKIEDYAFAYSQKLNKRCMCRGYAGQRIYENS